MSQKRTTSFRTNVWRSVVGRPHQESPSIRLKPAFARGLVLSIMMLASLATSSRAATIIGSHHGTICKNTFSWADTRIVYEVIGIHINNYNIPSDFKSIEVVCPLTRNTMNTNGAYVYVDVTHGATQTMTCTAYSRDYGGAPLASHTQSWTGSGRHEFELNLFGAGKSTPWSDYVVLCNMPGTSVATSVNGAYLHGVDLTGK